MTKRKNYSSRCRQVHAKYDPEREKHKESVFFEIKTFTGLEYVSSKEFS
jgi:hypothetical protein